jgi:hypothetical protein
VAIITGRICCGLRFALLMIWPSKGIAGGLAMLWFLGQYCLLSLVSVAGKSQMICLTWGRSRHLWDARTIIVDQIAVIVYDVNHASNFLFTAWTSSPLLDEVQSLLVDKQSTSGAG